MRGVLLQTLVVSAGGEAPTSQPGITAEALSTVGD